MKIQIKNYLVNIVIKEVEEKNDMWLVIKGDGLKRKSEEKHNKEVEILDKTIHVLEEKGNSYSEQ